MQNKTDAFFFFSLRKLVTDSGEKTPKFQHFASFCLWCETAGLSDDRDVALVRAGGPTPEVTPSHQHVRSNGNVLKKNSVKTESNGEPTSATGAPAGD